MYTLGATLCAGKSGSMKKLKSCSVASSQLELRELRVLMERHLGSVTGALYYQSEKETRGLQQHRYQADPAVQTPRNTHTHTQRTHTYPNPCKLRIKGRKIKPLQRTRAPAVRQDGVEGWETRGRLTKQRPLIQPPSKRLSFGPEVESLTAPLLACAAGHIN